jgi:2-polyprenyl-3-methyl-5-hydroxy-6-metoxy-1,4-benzoquinol methylase
MLCPICEGDTELLRVHSNWRYQRCGSCGHVFLAEPPSEQALREFYTTSENTEWNTVTFDFLDAYRRNPAAIRRYYARDRGPQLRRTLRGTPTGAKRVLDIGCGAGVFLATMRDADFQVMGQDLSPKATEEGRRHLGIELTDAPLSQIQQQFDLVTCYDVIEHWLTPKELLRQIRRLCAPDGTAVIRTPNHASWLRCLTGSKWLWYMPPAHVHLFTPASLSTLVRDSGFRVTTLSTGASSYLYFAGYYLSRGLLTSGRVGLDMPRWKEAAIFGLDRAIRLAALPLLLPVRALRADAYIEIHVRPA